jgi:hypothetical protein
MKPDIARVVQRKGLHGLRGIFGDMSDVDREMIENYFRQLFEAGWVGVESLLTKDQIEHSVTMDFVSGIFVATALACIEDDHNSNHPAAVEKCELLHRHFGDLQGVIAELIRRMEFNWQYVSVNQRTAADWESPDLNRVRIY